MPLFTKAGPRVIELPPAAIRPNPHQPRRQFDLDELTELARSIQALGVLQPLSVRKTPTGWELIAGERRLRAAKLAGLTTVPCLPVTADDERSSLLALVENLQRADLDVWEEAAALQTLINRFGLSQEEAARRVGKSQSAVANKLRLLKLPPEVIALLRDARLTERHARALLSLPSPALQRTAAEHIITAKLNVAQSEQYIARLCGQAAKPKKAIPLYRTKDVRLFLNTVRRSLSIMQSAGVAARWDRQETDEDLVLTIHIPKQPGV